MADWKITWGAVEFTDEDLTVGDLALASMLAGEGWNSCDPRSGPNACANLIAAVVARKLGRQPAEVSAEVAAQPAIRLLQAIGRPDGGTGPVSATVPSPPASPAAAAFA